MSINWIHVAIWAVIWLVAWKVGAIAYQAMRDRPGKGRHSR